MGQPGGGLIFHVPVSFNAEAGHTYLVVPIFGKDLTYGEGGASFRSWKPTVVDVTEEIGLGHTHTDKSTKFTVKRAS